MAFFVVRMWHAILKVTIVTLLGTAGGWWLSGFDRGLWADSPRANLIRRLVRLVATALLVSVAIWCQWRCYKSTDESTAESALFVYLAVVAALGFVWVGCLAEAGARFFVFLTDPIGHESDDPNRVQRDLDRLAELVRLRQNDDALTLCQQLEANHEISEPAAHEIYERLGVSKETAPAVKSVALAKQLQTAGRLAAAEALLKELLRARPRDLEAAFALMRLYLRDLKQPEKAREILQRLARQRHISRHHIEFAENSFAEWSRPLPPHTPVEKPVARTESITELIKQKRFGTVIEQLEKQIGDDPENFELRMQLIEVHGHYCGNLTTASKMIQQLKATTRFSEAHIESALNKLHDWRKAAGK